MNSIERNVLENFPGVAVCFDPRSKIIHLLEGSEKSRLFSAITTQSNLILDDLRAQIIDQERSKVIAKTNAAIASGDKWDIEYQLAVEGEIIWLHEQSYVSHDEALNQSVIGLFIREITESKNQQYKLSNDLNNASKSATMKNEFFASMSHEIRTPMNAVMGMAQILAKTPLDIEQKQYVNTIISSSNALVQIINDILDLSKLEAGKIDLLTEDVDLEYLCLEVCHLLSSKAREKHLPLFLNFQAIGCKKVSVDKGRLRQILVNLIGNAIKFTERGRVELLVEIINQADVPLFKFSVKDTGIGISESAKKTLFKAYSQADSSISQRFGGTGLGLQISQRLVNLMGGDIGVDSTVGAGSNFWFTLELSVVEIEKTIHRAGKHCLLVEPDSYSATLLESLLTYVGMTVTVTNDVEHTLGLLKKNGHFDYLLIDNTSEDFSGLKLASDIKQEKKYRNTPLVLLSSIDKRENSASLFDAGVNAYLPKPVSPSLIYRALVAAESGNAAFRKAVYISYETLGKTENSESTVIRASGKILIADDVEINQVILKSMLSQMGLDVDVANNGQEAVDMVAMNYYDLVFMDCRMPVLDGFGATRKIRALNSQQQSVPVIALTANAAESDKQQCLAAGMNDFLPKPYVEKDLVQVIRRWLESEVVQNESVTESRADAFENEILDHIQFDSIKDSLGDEFASFALDITDRFLNYQQDIINALKNGDMDTVVEKGHSLKGIAAMIGARQVADIAADIEQAGKETDPQVAFELAISSLTKLDAAVSKTHSMIIINLNPDIDKSIFLF